jgi:tetratricopeptide (TPR) repeat protein
MRYFPVMLAMILGMAVNAAAFDDVFAKAEAAYDDGRYAEAVILYDNMVSNGVENTEVIYNLANAYFKDGDLPKAVWHYRQAWYDAPRDPDIRANLHFALNAAGAIEPAPGLPGRIFSTLSANEWIVAIIAAYLLLVLLLAMSLLLRSMRFPLLKASLVPAALLLFALAGWRHWGQLGKAPEAVVVKSGTTALYGPVEGSTAHFDAPLAALVRQRESDQKGWIEIEYDGKTGWIKRGNILLLYP